MTINLCIIIHEKMQKETDEIFVCSLARKSRLMAAPLFFKTFLLKFFLSFPVANYV